MPATNLSRAAVLMALLVVVVIGGWELYLRHSGQTIDYDNGKELWADKRAMVYGPADKTVVFIGSSRIKYDLDIDTWRQLTGKQAVQLAIEGNSPVPVLKDLANDPKFHGKVVVDVTEPLFFSRDPEVTAEPEENIAYYKDETPAQKASFVLDHALESKFVFLDRYNFSVNAELDHLAPANRPGVFVFPIFPRDFTLCTFDRQSKMSDRFVKDTALQGRVQRIWVFLIGLKMSPPKIDPVPLVMATVKESVDKIRARGGEVVFVRTPSSGPMAEGEDKFFNRKRLWEPLLATTHAVGFHYKDDPATDHFICPEWSHLSPNDAVAYTHALVRMLPGSFVK